jgi:hypothetical protein
MSFAHIERKRNFGCEGSGLLFLRLAVAADDMRTRSGRRVACGRRIDFLEGVSTVGQLKSGILAASKACSDMAPGIKALGDQREQFTGRVYSQAQMIDEGVNVLVLYLIEKLKKANTTIEAKGADKLKDHLDANVASFGKGIVQAKADAKKTIATLTAEQNTSAAALQSSITEARANLAKLKALAEKKKAKWLKTDKYKAKIAGYLTSIQTIDTKLQAKAQAVQQIAGLHPDDAWVDKGFPFHQDMTLKQVHDITTMGLKSNLKTFDENNQVVVNRVKKIRDEYKTLAGQFATMKKWVDEADTMEKEAEG